MAWERRRGQAFYYRAVRVDGQPRKVYLGSGQAAATEAGRVKKRDRKRRADRESRLAEEARVAPAEAALARLEHAVKGLTRAALVAAGYHQHRGQWRKRRRVMTEQSGTAVAEPGRPTGRSGGADQKRPMATDSAPRGPESARGSAATPSQARRYCPPRPTGPASPTGRVAGTSAAPDDRQGQEAMGAPTRTPPGATPATPDGDPVGQEVVVAPSGQLLRSLAARADAGDLGALRELRRLLDEHPEAWKKVGDLAGLAEAAWIALIACGSSLLAESLRRTLAETTAGLAGPDPSPLVALLARHVGVTWLAATHAEVGAAAPGPASLGEATLRLRRAESALKRNLMAVRTLALVRSMRLDE